MAHKWRDIRRKLSPQVEEEIRREVEAIGDAMRLNQLREARNLTQANLASILGVNQGSVSKMEKRTDMYVSTLRSFIQAMGGQFRSRPFFRKGRFRLSSSRTWTPRLRIPEELRRRAFPAILQLLRTATADPSTAKAVHAVDGLFRSG